MGAVLSCPDWDQSRFVTSPVWDQSNFTIFDVFTKPVKSGSIQSRNFTIAVDSGYLLRFRLKQRLTSLNDLHLEAVMSRGPPDIGGMVSLKVDNLSYRWVHISLERAYQKLMVARTVGLRWADPFWVLWKEPIWWFIFWKLWLQLLFYVYYVENIFGPENIDFDPKTGSIMYDHVVFWKVAYNDKICLIKNESPLDKLKSKELSFAISTINHPWFELIINWAMNRIWVTFSEQNCDP